MKYILSIVAVVALFTVVSCKNSSVGDGKNQKKMAVQHTNALINETSPYLLQHAHNPVDWMPWGDEAWKKAKEENKLVIVSIGYSSCHWCHVMEHESFEDSAVAAVMNEHFVSIKVDREERPDIDQVYMSAVQLMTGRGGWPLNCITLPDGRPVYGGTYFPKDSWVKILESLVHEHQNNPQKMEEYASKLEQGIQQVELIASNDSDAVSKEAFHKMIKEVIDQFDEKNGGYNRAPKFPLPNNLEFFLHYHHLTRDAVYLAHVTNTLDQMANGGIYDQVGGGFARYSVDAKWKIPHFEKMLYDNAQLIGLYSNAYKVTGSKLYKKIVYETMNFLKREMKGKHGMYYSALDADTEGEEGKYYVWTEDELNALLTSEELNLIEEYFSFGKETYWEEEKHHLVRNPEASFEDEKFIALQKKLLEHRMKRTAPGLDDKCLTSWNALLISGYTKAYEAFGEQKFLTEAQSIAQTISETQLAKDGSLLRSFKDGEGSIDGFLEDYALLITAYIDLYEATFKEAYLDKAKLLTEYVKAHFEDNETGMFYFTSDQGETLIARKTEVSDNVIPASNSAMAIALNKLGHLLYKPDWMKQAGQMLHNMEPHITGYPMGYSNWLKLWLMDHYMFYETAITGQKAEELRQQLSANYLPNNIFAGAINNSKLEILKDKLNSESSLIYVCVNKACQLPVETPKEALKQLRN